MSQGATFGSDLCNVIRERQKDRDCMCLQGNLRTAQVNHSNR